MVEFMLAFGEEMEPGQEYEKYLKLLGLLPGISSSEKAKLDVCYG